MTIPAGAVSALSVPDEIVSADARGLRVIMMTLADLARYPEERASVIADYLSPDTDGCTRYVCGAALRTVCMEVMS